eukprot:TRINITY_DN15665_c0_g1_i1.p1 TRINITY_DN15665_c0_g1~~TRINITY_DN15665_c0_g1_i1.p1  ORF type:complete len:385 (-),score=65.17 TRINITY_DN15665_c0_g1_i1:37-1137(-)
MATTPQQLDVYSSVQNYYGKVLSNTKDLRTSACCTKARPHKVIKDILNTIPDEVKNKYYGCGIPIPLGITNLHVLDLGSGSGRDVYAIAALVGEGGSCTGIDMTQEQIDVANRWVDEYVKKRAAVSNRKIGAMKFLKGYIEHITDAGVSPNSMDLVISNCVINLSPDKPRVLQQVYEVLKEGGEFYFSDVYCDRRLPEVVRNHEVLFGECIAGAMYVQDFKRLCHATGFTDPRIIDSHSIEIEDEELRELVGEAKFFSITFRLFKLKSLETLCEDYGQYAVYLGTIEGHSSGYQLDDHHYLVKGKPFLVCGNTASMLSETWLKPHFQVVGSRDVHYGLFDCGSTNPTPPSTNSSSSSSCSSSGSCC